MRFELRAPDMDVLVEEAILCGHTDRYDVVVELVERGIAKGFYRMDGEKSIDYSLPEVAVAVMYGIEMRPVQKVLSK